MGGKQGAVEIVYLEERPSEVEGPFLAEERSLVDSLVEMLKLYLERKEASIRVAQFAQDLEERNKELLRLQGEVGRVERLAALGQITGSIAHDLGTPLNSVLGYTQILRQEKLPESAQRRLNIIETQVERMVEIINQYLSRSRDSFQKREGVNANKLIEETLDLLSPMFQQQQVEVTTNLSRSVPLIRGDVVSLQRVLINLLDNAIDAMGPGGRITITTGPTAPSERPQPGVSIMIIDTGPGIPADLLPKIFDFFVTTKAPSKGTGMGLAVCKEIVKQHGGTIHITSQEGQGTTVGLVLPIDATAGRDAAG